MTREHAAILSIISYAIRPGGTPIVLDNDINWKTIYQELKNQGCLCLSEPLLHSNIIPSREKETFEKTIATFQALYLKVISVQNKLCGILNKAGVHYVILKGLATAQFFSDPLLRSPGDIDFFVTPEDFDLAAGLLTGAGFVPEDSGGNRHTIFIFSGITVEMHRRFSLSYDSNRMLLLDQRILSEAVCPSSITVLQASFPSLSAQTCGLIILQHANQHCGEGLGLRQLVDWAVFLQNNLTDKEKWDAFFESAKALELDKFMLSLTRTSQICFKIAKDIPCPKASDSICLKLIEYIFESGNTGRKDTLGNSITAVMVNSKKDSGFFRSLQKNGLTSWKLLEKYPQLRPFAWMYQLKRYIAKAVNSGSPIIKALLKAKTQAKEREQFLRELGVTCRVKD